MFEIKKLLENVWLVTESFYSKDERANIFVVGNKDECLVIDSGLGYADLKAFLFEQGFRKIKVFITHSHFDHAGGMGDFLPEEILLTPKVFQNLDRGLWANEYLAETDFLIKEADRIRDFSDSFNICPRKESVIQNSFISVCDLTFDILPGPGHSDDSCVLLERNSGLIFTADVLYQGEIIFQLPNSSVANYVKTLSEIKTLDFQHVFAGHKKAQLSKDEALTQIDEWLSILGEAKQGAESC